MDSKTVFETMREQGLTDMHAHWIRIHWGDNAYSREAHLCAKTAPSPFGTGSPRDY